MANSEDNPPSSLCTLRWSAISKTVQVTEASQGLLQRSISKPRESVAKNNKKVILNQVSGVAYPGQVLAIMGPSGSGKTTLLDVLAGRRAYNAGIISAEDGANTGASPLSVKQIKRRIAYITQSDSFFGHLTVRDQLTYTALLRLPNSINDKHKVVDHMLTLFRLHKCADTQIRLLSGGEKKRINIGTELLTDPTLILLDEPLTGLDSTSAFALLQMLRDLATNRRTTIITSIHQPNSAMYQMFSSILWITDGFIVYHGSPMHSMSYLESKGYPCPPGYNVADHWMDLLVMSLERETKEHHNDEQGPRGSDTGSSTKQDEDAAEHLEEGYSDKMNTQENTQATSIRRRSSLLKWQNLSTRQQKRSSLLDQQLSASLATLTALRNSKAVLIDAWRNNEERQSFCSVEEVVQGRMQSSQQVSTQQSLKRKIEFNTSWWTQFTVLTHRSMKNSRSAIFTLLNVVKSVCLGVLTGLLWFNMPYTEAYVSDRSSYYFFTMTFWIFDALFGALFAFPEERVIILKERASGSYHLSAYFMAKTLSEAPVTVVLPFIYVVISYWMANVNTSFVVFLGTVGFNLLGVMAGESIGLLVGATVLDFEQAMAILVVASVTLMVAGGYYIENTPSFMAWFQYLSPFTYAYNGSVQLAFNRDVPCNDSNVLELVCGNGDAEYATPDQVLNFLNVSGTVGFNVGMLFVLIALPRTMAFWALKLKRVSERP